MVGKGPAHPPIRHHLTEGFDGSANVFGGEIRPQKVEGVAHVELVVAGGVGGNGFERSCPVSHLSHGGAPLIFIEQRAEALQEFDVFRPRLVVEMVLHAVGIDVGSVEPEAFLVEQRRVVAQKLVVEIVVDGIEPETVHAAIQPEAYRFQQRILNLGIVEIQVRLRRQEAVHVILLAHPVPFPGRSAEY